MTSDQQTPSPAVATFGAGLFVVILLLFLLFFVLYLVTIVKIVTRAGYPGWYVLLGFLPVLGLLLFAFIEWPVQRQARGAAGVSRTAGPHRPTAHPPPTYAYPPPSYPPGVANPAAPAPSSPGPTGPDARRVSDQARAEARSRSLTPTAAWQLSHSADTDVLLGLAGNPRTPPDLLALLAGHPLLPVRRAAQSRPRPPLELVDPESSAAAPSRQPYGPDDAHPAL